MIENQLLLVKYDSTKIEFVDYGGYESRNLATINLLKKAWLKYVKNTDQQQKTISIFTGDHYHHEYDYSYATFIGQSNRSFPCYIFDSWPEVGLKNYDDVFAQMIHGGEIEYENERVFWVGAESNPWRRIAYNIFQQEKNSNLAHIKLMDWNRANPEKLYSEDYVSLQDHCKYRVLIDFPGCGFSARLPLLMTSGRPVIVFGRPLEQWYYWSDEFIPWEHYIPCGNKDGSGITEDAILESVQWTFDNKEKAENIGKNGQEYAIKNFNKKTIIEKIGSILVNHKND